MNLTLNMSDWSEAGQWGVVETRQLAPCLQEYAVDAALRLSWALLILLLAYILYRRWLRPRVVLRFGETRAEWIDKGVLLACAGIAAVLTQALRTVAG